MGSENSLVSKYLSSKDPKVKAQLLVLIKAQGLKVDTPPPPDLSKEYEEAWYMLNEERKQEILAEWERLDSEPRWNGYHKMIWGGPIERH